MVLPARRAPPHRPRPALHHAEERGRQGPHPQAQRHRGRHVARQLQRHRAGPQPVLPRFVRVSKFVIKNNFLDFIIEIILNI